MAPHPLPAAERELAMLRRLRNHCGRMPTCLGGQWRYLIGEGECTEAVKRKPMPHPKPILDVSFYLNGNVDVGGPTNALAQDQLP
jgi:hypothetical protein